MEEQNENQDLELMRKDYVAAAARAALGAVPFAGSLLVELAGVIIPNQRVDRLVRFAQALEARLEAIEEGQVRAHLEDETFTDLLEEGMRQAARAISDKRKEYLASVIANSISHEQVDFIESKHLMNLLNDLNDIEIIWLRYYLNPTMGGDDEFRAAHAEVLERVMATMADPQEVHDREAIQNSYLEHLSRLRLLEPRYRTDHETGMPEFDRFTGELKIQNYQISSLGRLLLRSIGLSDSEE